MPYYVHRKEDKDCGSESVCKFTVRVDAHKYATDLTLTYGVAYMVTFKVSSAEVDAWQIRESTRFSTGEYLLVPWDDLDSAYRFRHHCVHLALKHPGMVAYTPSDEHGVQDRQVSLKPGKYLAQFYETDGLMTHQEVQSYVARCQVIEDTSKLSIARTADDIVRIYSGTAPAPLSCMHKHSSGRYLKTGDRHPCEVYGDSDLGIAYYGPVDSVEARAVCWPDKKLYGRVYGTRESGHVGTNGERLKRLLQDAGYRSGSMQNARVRAIEYDDGYLMPYIDGIDTATDLGNGYIKLDDYGPISTSETQGFSACSRDTEASCDNCNRTYDTEDDDCGDGLCARCYDARWTCGHCDDESFDHDNSIAVGDQMWCQFCYDNASVECQDADCETRWIEDNEFDSDETAVRRAHDTIDLCRECAKRYTWCDRCEASYEWRRKGTTDDIVCEDCGRSPRCEKTTDMLSLEQSLGSCVWVTLPVGDANVQSPF